VKIEQANTGQIVRRLSRVAWPRTSCRARTGHTCCWHYRSNGWAAGEKRPGTCGERFKSSLPVPTHITHLGLAYPPQGQAEEAIQCFSRGARLQPNNSEAYLRSALLLSQQNKPDDALAVLPKGACRIPGDPVLHFNLGIRPDRRPYREEAVRELRRALERDPDFSKIRDVLESILRRSK
jgi:tetratricopeptide (TPR) repeat protein